jgi:hypothetical protein
MSGECFMLDRGRQEQTLSRLDEILSRRGKEWAIHSRQDVLILAVHKLWAEILRADSQLATLPDSSAAD